MMIRVATFNLNNLFSRFNFQGEVDAIPPEGTGGITLTFEQNHFAARTFAGRLVREKDFSERNEIARRIKQVIDADVLAVQEVEHIEILRQFNREHLGNLYSHIALVEGNDQRLIDVGILSKLPIGTIVSHQTAVHPDVPNRRVFSRDLLQTEILDNNGNKLFTIYNTHLKSHFVTPGEDPVQGAINADNTRKRQAEMISTILTKMERPNSRFILAGDMNDPPHSEFLAPMLSVDNQPLINSLEHPAETRPAKAETPGQGPGPQSKSWTHRFNPPGEEFPRYELFDHIWVSPSLANRISNPTIDRRTKHTGDGSDHDPAWIDIDL
ncbi:MAG: endonuclease/exonuclease/phosphatase family protein [Nitrospira sp.]